MWLAGMEPTCIGWRGWSVFLLAHHQWCSVCVGIGAFPPWGLLSGVCGEMGHGWGGGGMISDRSWVCEPGDVICSILCGL